MTGVGFGVDQLCDILINVRGIVYKYILVYDQSLSRPSFSCICYQNNVSQPSRMPNVGGEILGKGFRKLFVNQLIGAIHFIVLNVKRKNCASINSSLLINKLPIGFAKANLYSS